VNTQKPVVVRHSIKQVCGSLLLVLTAVVSTPTPTQAALGEQLTSVEADRIRMHATAVAISVSVYTVHELLTPQQTILREYVSTAGRVFAVTWQGPYQPDLAQLLGSYFDTFKNAPRTTSGSRNQASIEQTNLVVHVAGHMRAFSGLAYDPQLLPVGVTVKELQ
jgi:Protein of unknown function (DUF2844)